MTNPDPDGIVEDYLRRLRAALEGAPADRREEMVREIAAHIAEARAELPHETPADVLNILERLGEPSALALEAIGYTKVRVWHRPTTWLAAGILTIAAAGGALAAVLGGSGAPTIPNPLVATSSTALLQSFPKVTPPILLEKGQIAVYGRDGRQEEDVKWEFYAKVSPLGPPGRLITSPQVPGAMFEPGLSSFASIQLNRVDGAGALGPAGNPTRMPQLVLAKGCPCSEGGSGPAGWLFGMMVIGVTSVKSSSVQITRVGLSPIAGPTETSSRLPGLYFFVLYVPSGTLTGLDALSPSGKVLLHVGPGAALPQLPPSHA